MSTKDGTQDRTQDIIVTSQMLALAKEDGRPFDAYLSRPPAGRAPGLLVLHDMFGLNEPIRAIADHYAERGYAALVPNLFWRSQTARPLSCLLYTSDAADERSSV